jgi:2-keto-3-deoxy-L-rhamnonate aldolase RhmA
MTAATAQRRNPFLDRLRAGELTLMLGIRGARTAEVVRIARATGHHAVLIDLEHSAMPIDVAAQLSAAAGDIGLTPFVRVPEQEYGAIGRLLDGGAHGIVVPRVESSAQARLISKACYFPPHGQRSQLSTVPQLGMRPTPARALNAALDASTILQVLIESPEGVANADAIAAVDGVDMIAIGANDLTAELGIPGEYQHPLMLDAVAAAARACERHDKLLMIGGVADMSAFDSLSSLGACPLRLTGMDTELLFSAAKTRAETIGARHGARAGLTTNGTRTS